MLTDLRGPILLAAVMTAGLVAGAYGVFSHTLMRGLGKSDDRTFVEAFQNIDRAIMNPLFMVTFMGPVVLSGVAALLYRGDGGGDVVPWAAAAFGLSLVVVIITGAVNVPLNNAIQAAGDPARISNLAEVREAFDENRWTAWNHARFLFSTIAFGLLSWALVLHGRID